MSDWIEWNGGHMAEFGGPYVEGTLVDVKFRSGSQHFGVPCGQGSLSWGHSGFGSDIVAYRLHESNYEKSKAIINSVMTGSPIQDQPDPKQSTHPAVWGLVMKDMVDRDQTGRERYGVPLQGHNGRDALVDAYQEALDLAVYLRQAIYERDGK